MILSKDDNTLNLTASILSAKSMLQTKLDEIGIDIKVIEKDLNTLKTEVTKLKKEVEETKEELIVAAEELKTKTDDERIKQKIDEVQTKPDEVEISDDFLDGLCFTTCNMMDGGCDCFGAGFDYEPTDCTDCYGYSETCRLNDLNHCPHCPENQFTTDQPVCPQEYCAQSFTDGEGTCDKDHGTEGGEAIDCWHDYDNQEGVQDSQCLRGYNTPTIDCKNIYKIKADGTATCVGGFTDKFDRYSCEEIYNVTKEGVACNGYESTEYERVSCEEGHEVLYDDQGFIGTSSCPKGYTDEENSVSCESDFFENNGVVSCSNMHTGNSGTCTGKHTWGDGIGGSCSPAFENAEMNCQGGVATNEAEQQVMCDGDYTAGNINCAGGFAEDVDDQVTFCPSNFTNGITTCRNMYMKQNGVETCTNNDPISCGSCVGGYCDYCGGCNGTCVSSCNSNCWHTTVNTCDGCYPSPYNTTCGAPSCGSIYDYCASEGHSITCTGGF